MDSCQGLEDPLINVYIDIRSAYGFVSRSGKDFNQCVNNWKRRYSNPGEMLIAQVKLVVVQASNSVKLVVVRDVKGALNSRQIGGRLFRKVSVKLEVIRTIRGASNCRQIGGHSRRKLI